MFVLNLYYCLHSYLALLEMYSHTSMGASQLCFSWFHFAFVGARNDPHHPSLQASCTGRGVQYVAGVGPSQVGRVRWTNSSSTWLISMSKNVGFTWVYPVDPTFGWKKEGVPGDIFHPKICQEVLSGLRHSARNSV